jgi:hypothetical protein
MIFFFFFTNSGRGVCVTGWQNGGLTLSICARELLYAVSHACVHMGKDMQYSMVYYSEVVWNLVLFAITVALVLVSLQSKSCKGHLSLVRN